MPEVLNVELQDNLNAAFDNSLDPIKSAFNDLNTVERRTFIDIQSSQGTSVLRDVESITNSASITETNSGEVQLNTGTTAGSNADIQTAQWGQYVSGYISQIGVGARLPTQPTGDGVIRFGYFDTDDGFYFGYDSAGLFVARRRNGSEVVKVYRSDWNGEDPDIERTDAAFTPSEGAIFQIDYAWYGYGAIEFRIVSGRNNEPQITTTVHRMSVDGSTTISNPNQPIRYEVDNGTGTQDIDAYLGGRQYSILGEPTDNFRITADSSTGNAVADGSWTHLQTFKRKASDSRRINAELRGFDINTTSDIRVALVLNPTLSGTSYGSIDLVADDETTFEYSESGTFDSIGDGIKIWEGFASSGFFTPGEDSLKGLRQVIPREQPISLIAQGVGAGATVDSTLRVREEW